MRPGRFSIISFHVAFYFLTAVNGFHSPGTTVRQGLETLEDSLTPTPQQHAWRFLHRKDPMIKARTQSLRSTSLNAVVPSSVVSLLRGGAEAALFNMERESHNLAAMSLYSTITALVMTASLRLYTSQTFVKNKETGKPRWSETIFNASTILCMISGIYTTLVFSILGIYSKEVLGLGNHIGYMAFKTGTAFYRNLGFWTFIYTGRAFVVSFLLSVYERTGNNKDRHGQFVLGVSILLALLGTYHLRHIHYLADQLIYAGNVA